MDTKVIEYFNPEFQYRAVKAVFEDKALIGDLMSVLDANAFQDIGLRALVTYVKDYYQENGYVPSYDILKLHFQ